MRRRERISASGKKNKHSRARREPAAAAAAAAALHHCAVRIYVAGKLEICGGRYPRATVYILDFFITALCRRCRRRGGDFENFLFSPLCFLYIFVSRPLACARTRVFFTYLLAGTPRAFKVVGDVFVLKRSRSFIPRFFSPSCTIFSR